MKCFNCAQEGHFAWQCPYKTELDPPAAGRHRAPASFPPPVAPRRYPDAPSDSYLAARAELGTPANPDAASLLAVKCPWCEAGPWQHCVNRALGTLKQQPHEARYKAAGLDISVRPDLADVARRQVEESRAARVVTG